MIHPALLAFDPAVPQRDWLLDQVQMRSHLAALGHGSAQAKWQIAKVKYHVGRDLRVLYRTAEGAHPRLVTVRTVRQSPDARFTAFPADRRLDWLPSLMAPRGSFDSLLGGAWTSSRLTGYAPEKSAVVACLGVRSAPVAFAKLFAYPGEARESFDNVDRVARASRAVDLVLRTPRPILLAEPQNLLLTEAARGRRLTELHGDALEHAVGFMGAALAELHATRAPLPAHRDRTADQALNDAARLIGGARPDLHEAVTGLAQLLNATRPSCTRTVPLHGDVHFKNALLDGERLWLIDFDQAHLGPAAADLGSVLALLRSDALVGIRTTAESIELADAFLRGYSDVRRLPPRAELRWHTSAALLAERALRAVTRVRCELLAHLPSLIDDARRRLERGAA